MGISAYVTPIGYVIADIEARLGEKVELCQLWNVESKDN